MTLLWLLLACATSEDPVAQALAPWPDDPDALLAICEQQTYPQMAITCRVQAAANLARSGQAERASGVCGQLPEGTWRDECHFRVGEELGKTGQPIAALRNCREAGWYGRFCLTHVGWNLPRDPAINPQTDPAKVEQAGRELLDQVDAVLDGAGDGLDGEGRDIVLSRFGFNVYVGSGRADPGPAHIDDPLGVSVRTGFAIEAARLLDAPTVEHIVAIWEGTEPPPTGAPLSEHQRMGRYEPPIQSPFEQQLPHLPIYGGGMRLVGQTPAEDIVIAALEALFFLPDTGGERVLPWVDDPRERVRWTAARLLCAMPSPDLDTEAVLTELAATHPDEGVRWQAAHGLEHHTWKRRRPR